MQNIKILLCLGILMKGQVPETLMINKVFKQFFMIGLYLCLTVEEGGFMIYIYIYIYDIYMIYI